MTSSTSLSPTADNNENKQSQLAVILLSILGAVAVVSLVVATVCVAFVNRSRRAEEAARRPCDRLNTETEADVIKNDEADVIGDLPTPLQVLEPQPVAVQEAPRDELSHQSTMV